MNATSKKAASRAVLGPGSTTILVILNGAKNLLCFPDNCGILHYAQDDKKTMVKKQRVPLLMPDLGIEDQPTTVSLWFARRGQRVEEGEPLVEILCGPATVDLPAPASGILAEKRISVNEEVQAGQTLAVIVMQNT